MEFKSLRSYDAPRLLIYRFSDAAVHSRHRERMDRGIRRLGDAVTEDKHPLCRPISGSPREASQRFSGEFLTWEKGEGSLPGPISPFSSHHETGNNKYGE